MPIMSIPTSDPCFIVSRTKTWTRAVLTGLALFLFAWPASSSADMGGIFLGRDVTVHEPGQKAIIAHDGTEEVLILGTDLKSSGQTKVLRFIPLPAEPRVTLAGKETFARLQNILDRHGLRYRQRRRIGGLARPEAPGGPVELRFHKRLGAHDVSVVRVNRVEHFASWVSGYFKGLGFETPPLRSQEVAVVRDYVQRGIRFFVFDLVQLNGETVSVDPLVYRFPSRRLYYPLKATNLFGGRGRIELYVFSDRGACYPFLEHMVQEGGQSPSIWWTATSTVAEVTGKEMATVDPALRDLLGANAKLQAFMREGLLQFDQDIMISIPLPGPRVPAILPFPLRGPKAPLQPE